MADQAPCDIRGAISISDASYQSKPSLTLTFIITRTVKNAMYSLCSPWMTRANRSALFPPVHQRMTGMRLFPRAGQVINAQCSWHKKHSISGKENSKTIH